MLRTLSRAVINGALLLGALAVVAHLMSARVYQHASHDTRIVLLAAPAAAFFAVAFVLLHLVVPSAKQLEKRGKRQKGRRPSFGYPAVKPRGVGRSSRWAR